jgi:ABC-type transport system involved in multi-copper enzyme maturation permease subunit
MNMHEQSVSPATLPHRAALWSRQIQAIFRIEVGRTLFSRRALIGYVLALIPILVFAGSIYGSALRGDSVFNTIENAREFFGLIFSSLILGAVIFLGSAAIFTTLFRGEILERSIHYYLLTPVRREVLVAGKFLAGLASSIILFGLGTLISYLMMYLTFGTGPLITDLNNGIALQQLGQYLGITLLACMGYGAIFMTTGLLFRNPLIPVAVIAAWELIHFLLPPALKILSVIYYLKGLLPIPMHEGKLAVIVAPPPVWISLVGMFGLTAVALAGAVMVLKRMELRYTEE